MMVSRTSRMLASTDTQAMSVRGIMISRTTVVPSEKIERIISLSSSLTNPSSSLASIKSWISSEVIFLRPATSRLTSSINPDFLLPPPSSNVRILRRYKQQNQSDVSVWVLSHILESQQDKNGDAGSDQGA